MAGIKKLSALGERRLSVMAFVLFSAWLLAFAFEGRVLYAIFGPYFPDPHRLALGAVLSHLAGLVFFGLLITAKKTARRMMLVAPGACFLLSAVFFLPYSLLWPAALLLGAFMISACITGWAYYFQSAPPGGERLATAADVLIFSNLLMIFLNFAAVRLSPRLGLALAMLMLLLSFLVALHLPAAGQASLPVSRGKTGTPGIARPLALLCLFVFIVTINSGLMYQVINPAFAHLNGLTSWYWAVPYIGAIYILKKLPRQADRTYILYVAMAMIGLAYVAYMLLDRSVAGYLVVDTFLLGAFGIYDLFWWSILAEMLDLDQNPARILGAGLAANVLGVLLGGVAGNAMFSAGMAPHHSSAVALVVVCLALLVLPQLHRVLASVLFNHAFLSAFPALVANIASPPPFLPVAGLSARENQVIALLLRGRTYKAIGNALHISENTVRTHVKNIYSKLGVNSRTELMALFPDKDDFTPDSPRL